MSALNWKPFVYGGLASITAECGTFPIDLTKTRLQIQGQTNDANFKEIRYRGMLHALVRIGREEGLKALYSGIAPAMLRQASYGTIKIGTYQSLKRLFVEHPEDETLLINVVCGILSGVVSSTIANPTDVLKIRMQAQSSTIQGGMIGNFINIYQQEGARGLWKGVSLTAQRAAIVVGVELPVYDLTKKHLILSGLMGDTVYTHFLSSFTCGLAGALASNPVDVVRTRMMNQRVLRDGRCSGYTGTLDCLLQVRVNALLGRVVRSFHSPVASLFPSEELLVTIQTTGVRARQTCGFVPCNCVTSVDTDSLPQFPHKWNGTTVASTSQGCGKNH
ncbi:unnamed protein product [Nyctereutes procyonoides]|uniref:(raccoon dog) hypothetical protein n=1 Tax=Nyctereutes procyonoides TaxID=34880 RepID=A0A811YTG1_NYCPR|nr:unnamed protein product [Nyctereutes procyonoides]